MDSIALPTDLSPTVARIAFSKIKGINRTTAARILGRLGSPEAFFTFPAHAIASACGLDSRLCSASTRLELINAARREARFVEEKSIDIHFVDEPSYPRRLVDCDDAPALLYSIGACNLDSLHSIAIVGTRHATPYGLDFVNRLVDDLAARLDSLVIISGLAYGIDIAAHRAALKAGVPTVAVMAHGLNTIYPADHRSTAADIVKSGGAIVTEYSSDQPIHKGNFLARNRIVAALADVVIVIESDIRGGALVTARIASAYNREVMAVPGRTTDTYSRGCNGLIADKAASILRSADDIIAAMGWTEKPQPSQQPELSFSLTPEQQTVAQHIAAHPEHTINDICIALDIPYGRLSSMLFEMEMADLIITLPGGRYTLIAPINQKK